MYNILVVEDDADLRNNLEEILTEEGYNVIFAKDGLEGYLSVLEKRPDLIISDIQMPNLNGLELLEKLQKDPATDTIPFILFSARNDNISIRKGMTIGADDYITKPFKVDDLLNAIEVRLRKNVTHSISALNFKNNVIKKVAHELRTPLLSVLSYPELLVDNIDDLSIDEIRSIAASMKKSGREMRNNVEKILTYSELLYIEENPSERGLLSSLSAGVEGNSFLADLLAGYENKSIAEKILLANAKIKVAESHLVEIFKELIDLGEKYARDGVKYKITGTAEGRLYKISTRYEGDIPVETSLPLREPDNLSNENAMRTGLGLELVIVKKIVDLYNGLFEIKLKQSATEIDISFFTL